MGEGSDPATVTRPHGRGSDDSQFAPLSEGALRFARYAVPLAGLAIVTTFFAASYVGTSPIELLSYVVDDRWCDTATQGIGLHCFGDYALVDDMFATGDPWHSAMSGNASWPALAWLPALIAWKIGVWVGVGWLGAVLFAVVSGLAMLSPAWWATRGANGWTRAGALALGGAATVPFISTIDRGNPVGLVVPLLLWAGVAYARRDWSAMTVAIVLASLLKPQMILLLVLPLIHRQLRQVILGGLASAALTIAGFLVFPQAFPGNVIAWAREILNRTGDYQPLDQVYPYNIGVGRSLLTVVDATGVGALLGDFHRSTVISYLTIAAPGFLLILVASGVAALWFGRSRLGTTQTFALAMLICLYTSSTIYLYYLVVLLVVLAMVVRDPLAAGGASDTARGPGTSRMTVAVIAIVLAPVLIPVPARWFGESIVSFSLVEIQTVSLWQVLLGPLVLAWFCGLVLVETGVAEHLRRLASGRGRRADRIEGSEARSGSRHGRRPPQPSGHGDDL